VTLPQGVLSTTPVPAQFRYPRNVPRAALVDYEYGGKALQDSSKGLRYQVWKAEYIEDQIVLSAPEVAATAIITVPNITEFGFTFDQNMNPFIAYELANGTAKYYWFDATIPGFTTTTLPADSFSPRCCLDDNRALEIPISDIVLAYVRAGTLYMRIQRERYNTEHELSDQVGGSRLLQMGLNEQLRMQFLMSSTPEQLDSLGAP
jgi:hypothetical protein